MADFDLAAAQARLLEYANRTKLEQREPTRKYELQEPEGWSTRIREELLGAEVVNLDITEDDMRAYRGVELSEEQVRWHRENDIRVTNPTILLDSDGNLFAVYLPHYLVIIWGKEKAAQLVKDLEFAVNLLNEYIEPGPPKHNDERFAEGYAEDKARADLLGWVCGVLHISFRRENGNAKVVPMLSTETIASRHTLGAIDRFMRDLTPIKQSLGMGLSVVAPKQYAESHTVAKHWEEESIFGGLVHSAREFATTTVINSNLMTNQHVDPGDFSGTLSALHSWGDYDREKGGELSVPIAMRSFVLYEDAVLYMRSGDLLHYVRRPVVDGQRFSMVHVTQKNMSKFNDIALPLKPAERRALIAAASADDDIEYCPFCNNNGGKPFKGGRKAVISHLGKIIKKINAGEQDSKHDLATITAWKNKNSEDIAREGLARRVENANKRKAEEALEKDSDAEEENNEPVKRRKAVKKAKRSEKYERYAAPLFQGKD